MSNLPTLDRNREYGYIAGHFEEGDPMLGAAYSQDGFLFNHQGEIIESAMTDADRKRLDVVVERNTAMEAARAAFLQIAPNTDEATLSKIITTETLNKAGDDEEVDLVAWAQGTKLYNYGKVAKAFRDRFHQSPVNKAQGLEILAEHGLIAGTGRAGTIPSQQ